MKYTPYLDGWRGLAIILVLLHHFAGFTAGEVGVQVFFVLSGKLMSQVLFVDRVSLATFYRRRIARVFPGLYLYLGCVAAGVLTLGLPVRELAYTATFLRTYLPGQSVWDLALPTGHLWSLNVEEHSYVALSLVALLIPRGAKVALPLFAVGCLAAFTYYSAHPPLTGTSPAMLRTECAAFSLMLSAGLHLYVKRPSAWQFWTAAGAVGGLFMSLLVVPSNGVRLVLLPAGLAVLINVLSAAPSAVHAALSAPWLRWFGVVSFSLYVWQQLFLWLSMRGVMSPAQGLIGAAIAGTAAFYCFELPMRAWVRGKSPSTLYRSLT